MNIDLNKTIKKIDACLPKCGRGSIDQLHKMYDLTLRLQSQILAIIYDLETFSFRPSRKAENYRSGIASEQKITVPSHCLYMNRFPQ